MKTPDPSATPSRTAYSYVRFSSPQQAEGDSFRRQTERAAAYCQRRGWHLDNSLTYRDLGVSAFRGKNALVGNLKKFLDAIKAGKVKPGSALIVESLDRISRQGIDEGYDLIKSILKAGVHIVTLSPEREFDRDATRSLSKGALEIQLILERAAEESQTKSDRCGAACQKARDRARNGEIAFRCIPAWVEIIGDKFRLKPGPAAAVKRIFELAISGYGGITIVNRLTKDGVPPFGKVSKWTHSYVSRILNDRRALGEYQPRLSNGEPEGAPVPDYFPAVVTETEYHAARAGAAQRRRNPGRIGTNGVYPLAGLLHNAKEGDPVYVAQSNFKINGERPRVLASAGGIAGQAKYESFRLAVFERALFGLFAEIDPGEIIGQTDAPKEVDALKGELEELEAREAELGGALAGVDLNELPGIAKAVRELKDRKQELKARLATEQQKAAHPISQSWTDAKSLLATLNSAPDPDDARLRLRAILRRIVSEIWLLIAHQGRDAFCVVQVYFADAERSRDYFIAHRPPRGNANARKPGRWLGISVACPNIADRGAVPDLRRYKDDPAVRDYFDERMARQIEAAREFFAADEEARKALGGKLPEQTGQKGRAGFITGIID